MAYTAERINGSQPIERLAQVLITLVNISMEKK